MKKKTWFLASNKEETIILHATPQDAISKKLFNWGSLSASSETKENLIKDQGIPVEPCKVCGNVFGTNFHDPVKQKLLEKNICHTCDFWQSKEDIKDNPRTVRVKGTHYYIEDDKPHNTSFLGFGGAEFNIKFNDGRLVITHNLWCQGDIPERFRGKLPDNAVFL